MFTSCDITLYSYREDYIFDVKKCDNYKIYNVRCSIVFSQLFEDRSKIAIKDNMLLEITERIKTINVSIFFN